MYLHINGREVGEGLQQLEVTNPVTQEVIDTVPEVPEELISEAVSAAREGLAEWGGLSQAKRNEILYRYIELYEQKRHDIAKILTMETGKTLAAVSYTHLDVYKRQGGMCLRDGVQALRRPVYADADLEEYYDGKYQAFLPHQDGCEKGT